MNINDKTYTLTPDVNGKRVALIGAGVSNMPLIGFIRDLGGSVTVREKKSEMELGVRADEIRALGAKLICGEDYLDGLSEDIIIRSPGIRPDIEEFSGALSRGACLACEMEMFLANAPCPVFAVTGSDGKSTTTTILSKLLMPEGDAYLGGNIGEPLFQKVLGMTHRDMAAVELSSFQLMTADVAVRAAVITNITPNHLNWHTDMDEYIAAKCRILRHAERAVLNFDNDITRRIGHELIESGAVPVTWFSLSPMSREDSIGAERVLYLENGTVKVVDPLGDTTEIFKCDRVVLPGRHNIANYMAAAGAAWDVTTVERIREVAESFAGVRHRLQFVAESDGVRYYNSSIDSSPTRTAAAVSALRDTAPDRRIVIICGGYDKNIPFEPLAEMLLSEKIIKTVVLTGATREKILASIESSPLYESRRDTISIKTVPDFDSAVYAAAESASCGDSVLLSPACASFDAFPNFEVRGERFANLAAKISGKV